jgi:hypothetical protein
VSRNSRKSSSCTYFKFCAEHKHSDVCNGSWSIGCGGRCASAAGGGGVCVTEEWHTDSCVATAIGCSTCHATHCSHHPAQTQTQTSRQHTSRVCVCLGGGHFWWPKCKGEGGGGPLSGQLQSFLGARVHIQPL